MGKAFKTITFRRCDFCNSSKLKELNIEVFDTYTRDEIKQVDLRNNICEDCGLIFRNPMPTPEALRRFYAESFILMTEHKEGESTLRYDPVKKSQFDFIQPLIRNSRGKVLEIGCYEGGFLSFFDNARWARFGVEPTPSSADVGRRRYGINVREGFFEDVDFGEEQYDAVVALHVIEHAHRPSEFFRKVYGLLKPGGLFFAEVPNVELISTDSITSFFNFEHLYYFTPKTFANYLRRFGFDVAKTEENPGYPALRMVGRRNFESDYARLMSSFLEKSKRKRRFTSKLVARLGGLSRRWKNKKILIYAAGNHTTFLLSVFDFAQLNVVAIADSDKRKQGKLFHGFEVQGPDAIEREKPDVIIISSYACQNEIYGPLKKYEEKGIEIVRLYDEVFDLESFGAVQFGSSCG